MRLASLLNASKHAPIQHLSMLVASHHIAQQDTPILVADHAQIILLLSLLTAAILRVLTLLPFRFLLDLFHDHALPDTLARRRITSRTICTRPKTA